MEMMYFAPSQKTIPEIAETVFDSLNGFLLPEYQLPWVKDIFVPGNPCYVEYRQAQELCLRLQTRLGADQEDRELVALMDHMAAYGKHLALEMFCCGMEYCRMQNQAE